MFVSIVQKETLLRHAQALRRRKFTPGFDSVTADGVAAQLQINGDRLCRELRDGAYAPMPAVAFRHAKRGGGYRTLYRLTAMDTVLQNAILEAVTPHCEARFSDNSFAYRTGRGVAAALERYVHLANRFKFAVKLDFVGCFDAFEHEDVERELRTFFEDERLVGLIMKCVTMPVSEDGAIVQPTKGLLQGMPLAPLLCNIVLHSADRFWEEQGVTFIRYADDIVLFAETAPQAQALKMQAEQLYAQRYRLRLNSKKCGVESPVKLRYLGHRFDTDKRGVIALEENADTKTAYHLWHRSVPRYNHRRVDILRDGVLRQKDMTLLFEDESGEVVIPPACTDVINVYADVVMDNGFLKTAMKHGILIHLHDKGGKKLGAVYPEGTLRAPSLLHAQLLAYYDEQHRLALAREFVLGSLHNTNLVIRYYHKQHPREEFEAALKTLARLKQSIKNAEDHEQLLLKEAKARQAYYACYDLFLQEEDFVFDVRTRRPPKNEINAMISFGNVVLYNLLATEIYKTSLDIQVGFLHATNARKESLQLDVAELFKPLLVDRVVFSLINRHIVRKEHFMQTENGGVYLNEEGKRLFLQAFYGKLSTTVASGKESHSYDSLIAEEIRKLARHFRSEEPYKAFRQVR